MADSQLILELLFLQRRGGCSLTVLLFFLMLVEKSFSVCQEMLPLFRAVLKFCSTNRLFSLNILYLNTSWFCLLCLHLLRPVNCFSTTGSSE